ncbi:pyruvate formate-lyase-activating enzyme [Clostridia bacterium]|nr:pyruvate formate-lyase-activating enzyme [Clostridia bacterium]
MRIGYLHSIETLGATDGPGIRTVLFMQGCPYRCLFCHNPDTWEPDKYALKFTPERLCKKLLRFKEYYGKTGGVTAGGGEPLLQAAFLTELFTLLKKEGIQTAVDTAYGLFSLSLPVTGCPSKENRPTEKENKDKIQDTRHNAQCTMNEDILKLLNVTDLVILDIKHTDPARFNRLCGLVPDNKRNADPNGGGKAQPSGTNRLQNTLSFLSLCASLRKRIWLRQVIVPGYTDSEEQVRKLKEIADTYGAEKVELLPYHTAGAYKWDALNIPYPLSGVEPPTEEIMRRLNAVLQD